MLRIVESFSLKVLFSIIFFGIFLSNHQLLASMPWGISHSGGRVILLTGETGEEQMRVGTPGRCWPNPIDISMGKVQFYRLLSANIVANGNFVVLYFEIGNEGYNEIWDIKNEEIFRTIRGHKIKEMVINNADDFIVLDSENHLAWWNTEKSGGDKEHPFAYEPMRKDTKITKSPLNRGQEAIQKFEKARDIDYDDLANFSNDRIDCQKFYAEDVLTVLKEHGFGEIAENFVEESIGSSEKQCDEAETPHLEENTNTSGMLNDQTNEEADEQDQRKKPNSFCRSCKILGLGAIAGALAVASVRLPTIVCHEEP